jgi:hypothetical protein
MKFLFKTIFFFLGINGLFAQTSPQPQMRDFLKEFEEMQRRMFKNLRGDNFNLHGFQWDTTFSFKFDTLGGDGWSHRFFFSPDQPDSLWMGKFQDGNPFGEGSQFWDGIFEWPPRLQNPSNPEQDENSAIDGPDDGLLPEERLRKEAESPSATDKSEKNKPKKSNIKTIRI